MGAHEPTFLPLWVPKRSDPELGARHGESVGGFSQPESRAVFSVFENTESTPCP